jgi:predicted nucleotidyltransferase
VAVHEFMKRHIYTVSEISHIVAPIAKNYGIKKLSLFGSYARGDATESSDMDFLICDKGSLRGLFSLAGFHLALEESFGLRVDVLTTGSLEKDFLSNIKDDGIIVYEN